MITTPCYCTREDVKSAPDFKSTAYNNAQLDRAIQSASRDIDKRLKRTFYPNDTVKYLDWPPQGGQGGGQIAYPWRVWLDGNDLVSLTALESPPGTSINTAYVNLEPANYGPPYTYLELQRDKNQAFSSGPTPQRSIKITGTWGYSLDLDSAGTLAAAISSTSATTLTVSDASQVGVGDLLVIDSERLLVSDRSATSSGQTNLSGATTALNNDVAITVTDGTQLHVGEVILIDQERMLIVDITGNVVTVKRQYDGSVLATHSSSTTINVYRVLTVLRGQLGTTAATHSNSAPISKLRVPYLIRDLAVAVAVNRVMQETGSYSNPQGESGAQISGIGTALADLWMDVIRAHGRKSRFRAV